MNALRQVQIQREWLGYEEARHHPRAGPCRPRPSMGVHLRLLRKEGRPDQGRRRHDERAQQ